MAAHWLDELSTEFATLHSDVDFDLRRRMQQVMVATEGAIAELDPARDWAELTTWLRERLAFELRENHNLAVSSMRALSVRSARRLGLRESQVIDPPAPSAPVKLSVSLDSLPKSPLGTQGMVTNVVLRGYLGFVMFFMLNSFTGLGLPLPAGIAPAVLLAVLALREDRGRRLAARRGAAEQLFRDYVTEFGMWVNKASQDMLRHLEREVRTGYEARIQANFPRSLGA